MILPHGADALTPLYVDDYNRRAELRTSSKNLPSIGISSQGAANAVMLGAGYFTPITGFMDRENALSVAKSMHTIDGLFWPVPILCLVPEAQHLSAGDRVALRDPNVNDNPTLAILEIDKVETLSDIDMETICTNVYRTTNSAHTRG